MPQLSVCKWSGSSSSCKEGGVVRTFVIWQTSHLRSIFEVWEEGGGEPNLTRGGWQHRSRRPHGTTPGCVLDILLYCSHLNHHHCHHLHHHQYHHHMELHGALFLTSIPFVFMSIIIVISNMNIMTWPCFWHPPPLLIIIIVIIITTMSSTLS